MKVLKDSAILSLNEFNRIKQNSFFSPKSISNYRSFSEVDPNTANASSIIEDPNEKLTKALNHKKKLIEYEKTINRSSNPLFMEKKEDPYKVVGGKENEVVKAFDVLCRKAKAATIWDRQMDERKMMEGMYINKERRLDEMMELERLKEIQYIEQKEKAGRVVNVEGQKAIIDQIFNHDRERNIKREQVEREKILMLKQLERLKEEDKQIAIRKKMEAEAKNRECMEAQKILALNKKKKLLEEKEEDLKNLKFNLEKDRKEEELLAEKKRLAIQREKEIQALREKQEKQKDKMDEINEKKAKRAQEEAYLKELQREKEELLKKERMMKEIRESNDKMLLLKKKLSEQEAIKDKEMVEKIKLENQKVEEEEKIRRKIQLEKHLANKHQIEKQIEDKEEKEKLRRIRELEEEKKIKKEYDKYMMSLEQIRRMKIKELKDLNIKDTYILPLEKYNYKNIENKSSS